MAGAFAPAPTRWLDAIGTAISVLIVELSFSFSLASHQLTSTTVSSRLSTVYLPEGSPIVALLRLEAELSPKPVMFLL